MESNNMMLKDKRNLQKINFQIKMLSQNHFKKTLKNSTMLLDILLKSLNSQF